MLEGYLLFLNILINFYLGSVSSGANDLHFYEINSATDVITGDVFFEIIYPPELHHSFRIRPARNFGMPFNESVQFEGIRLVPTVPLDACDDLNEEVLGNIALSKRGGCTFVAKAVNAQKAGARAIIITESVGIFNENVDILIEMVDDRSDFDVNIPAAFLIGQSGEIILKTLKDQGRPHAIINLPVNMTNVALSKMNQPSWILV